MKALLIKVKRTKNYVRFGLPESDTSGFLVTLYVPVTDPLSEEDSLAVFLTPPGK